MKCLHRLYLNAAATALVAEGDKDAATLYATPGDEIPDSAVEMFGLGEDGLPTLRRAQGNRSKSKAASAGTKQAKPGSNKEAKPGSDKEAKPGTNKETSEDGPDGTPKVGTDNPEPAAAESTKA